ncbi:MAG: hypothetical protein IT233_12630 [Bacteroidia bacterium]|nr:hypothetical protein [Bacteroidia bacterium]
MQVITKRHIKPGIQYDSLFPKAEMEEITVQRNANVGHTVRFIPKVVSETLFHTAGISRLLKGNSIKETCQRIWDFVYTHINYRKDEDGKEQVRSPARAWHDRHQGVDCDCYTVFISSILSNLRVPHFLRIVKYSGNNFSHIYPVVSLLGETIILDCVVDRFNYEEPFTQKKDFTMDLNYLNGVPEKSLNIDAEMFDDGQSDLGKLADLFKKKKPASTSTTSKKESKVKTFLKKAVNVVNKVNPATVLLRAGILASMKTNFMKVAQRIKYAYLSDADAQKRGVDMQKFTQLKTIKGKLEKIFFAAGGKPENLKESILKGKGNQNKEVPLSGYDEAVTAMNERTPLTELLGQDVYYSEFMQGTDEIEGLAGLGEPATATAIASSTGVLAVIAGFLKKIGNLFPKKNKEAADFEDTADVDKEIEKINKTEPQVDLDALPKTIEDETPAPDSSSQRTAGEDTPPEEKDETFWEKNKKWLKPTLWGTGILSALGLGYLAFKPKQQDKEKKEKPLEGVGRKKSKPGRRTGEKKFKTIELK